MVRRVLSTVVAMIEDQEGSSMQIATIGIDIGKSSFHVVGLDARGAIVLRRRCSRK
jgi:hypothetical protein